METKKGLINSGIWLAITEFASYHESRQLIGVVLKSFGFSREECITLMDDNPFNREEIEPYVNNL